MIFDQRRPALITGGAGFIGTNLADRLLTAGQPVVVLDNLSRPGVAENLSWLRYQHRGGLDPRIGDVRDAPLLRRLVRRACAVFHLAAQVAVTTSLADPVHDFTVNALGTLNVLEALRAQASPPPLLYTSTNKVYGPLAGIKVKVVKGRYLPEDRELRRSGISEAQPLDFHSPYGCSKGAADQYVLDYARIYRVPAVVFRMSCIYGPHQRGNEDQGWVAHFLMRALRGETITIYGDGLQVRDALYADDLVDAMIMAQRRMGSIAGRAFNIGGGPERAMSLRQLLELVRRLRGAPPAVRFDAWRPADQRYYVSDISAFAQATGWAPRVSAEDGVTRLHAHLSAARIALSTTSTAEPPARARAAAGS
jgi:CDP-paratose 2-epimerase